MSEVWIDYQRPDGSTIRVERAGKSVEMSPSDFATVVPVRFIRCQCGLRNDLPREPIESSHITKAASR